MKHKNEYFIIKNAIKSLKIKQKARRRRKEIIRRSDSRNLQCRQQIPRYSR
jgi:hypothetical protein